MKLPPLFLAGLGYLLWVSPDLAQAADVDDFGPLRNDSRFQTPQTMAFELRIGPYLPNIDDEFGSSTPFADHFGNDTRWHLGVEVDWQLLRIPSFGSIGPGIGLGFTSLEGTTVDDSGNGAEQNTTLSILPMHLVGVVRVETLIEQTLIPLVPYAKLGLGYAMWWTDDGQANLERSPDGIAGEDTSYGTVWALGAMLLLDVFDPVAAADLDSTSGINHSYVYVEWFNSDLDGFNSGKLQVGVNTWMAGLALEM